jgi:hypothetical protein
MEGQHVRYGSSSGQASTHQARKPVVGMDKAVALALFFLKAKEVKDKGMHVGVKTLQLSIRGAAIEMNDPNVVSQRNHVPILAAMTPGEDVHLNSHGAQVAGELPDVDVQAPHLTGPRRQPRAGVKAYHRHFNIVQRFWTTMV